MTLVVIAGLAVFGVVAAIMALGYGVFGDDGRIGAGFLPAVAATAVAVCATLDLLRQLRRPGRGAETSSPLEAVASEASGEHVEPAAFDEAEPDVDIFGRTPRQRTRMLAFVLGFVAVALLLVPVLGFLVSFGLLLVACSFVVEGRKLVPTLLVSTTALAVAWLVFAVMLRVPLPTGILGI